MDDKLPRTTNAPTETGVSEDFLPGTRLLIDQNHVVQTAHATGEIVLLPPPTDHPNDPLNWSTTRIYFGIFVACFWTMLLAAMAIIPNVTYGALIVELGASVGYLNTGAAVSLLFFGVGNLFWNPLSIRYGRRPVYLATTIICMVSQIVAAIAPDKATAVGARILAGFAAAPLEYLPAVTVNDTLFVHRRGFGLSLYILALTLGSFLGPISAGFVIAPMGWRWCHWFLTIFLGFTIVLVFFGLEETAFPRHLYPVRGSGEVAPDEVAETYSDAKTSYTYRLRLWTRIPLEPGETLFRRIYLPLRLSFEPIVLYCGILYGFAVSWLSVMSVTGVQVFQNPMLPYNFSFSAIGLTNFGPLIGALIILYLGGAGTDRFMIWRARRNNGIMEAESRIYSVFIAGPIMCAGLMLYGVGASKGLPWIALVIGMSFVGAGIPIAGEVSLGYVSECYPNLVGEVTTSVILIRNVIGCGMTFAIEPWIASSGLQNTFIAVGILALVVFYLGAFFIWKGKACRRRSAKKNFG